LPRQLPIPQDCQIEVLVDVQNPLYGPEGASVIFGPQKGASPAIVDQLDQGMKNLANSIKNDLNGEVADIPGSGAAGGLGAGLIAFCDAEIRPGIQSILEIIGFQEDLKDADLVITGEGKLDQQTSGGKLIQGICQAAALEGVPVIALCGTLLADFETTDRLGLSAAFSILNRPMSLETALAETEHLLAEASAQVYSIFQQKL
ncbi:MAG: glycerate kinase, partial [Bacteroidota bacterium]